MHSRNHIAEAYIAARIERKQLRVELREEADAPEGLSQKRYTPKPGDRYGDLCVVGPAGKHQRGGTLWRLVCDCGESRFALSSNINAWMRRGAVPACAGCVRKRALEINRYASRHYADAWRRQFVDTGTLYTARQITNICDDVRRALEEAFGGIPDRLSLPVNVDPTWKESRRRPDYGAPDPEAGADMMSEIAENHRAISQWMNDALKAGK